MNKKESKSLEIGKCFVMVVDRREMSMEPESVITHTMAKSNHVGFLLADSVGVVDGDYVLNVRLFAKFNQHTGETVSVSRKAQDLELKNPKVEQFEDGCVRFLEGEHLSFMVVHNVGDLPDYCQQFYESESRSTSSSVPEPTGLGYASYE